MKTQPREVGRQSTLLPTTVHTAVNVSYIRENTDRSLVTRAFSDRPAAEPYRPAKETTVSSLAYRTITARSFRSYRFSEFSAFLRAARLYIYLSFLLFSLIYLPLSTLPYSRLSFLLVRLSVSRRRRRELKTERLEEGRFIMYTERTASRLFVCARPFGFG